MSAPRTDSNPENQRTRRRRWLLGFSGSSLAIAIFLHVLFGIGAAYWIVEHFQKKHVNFRSTAAPAPNTEVEHKIEMSKKNTVDSAPPDLKRIVTTDVSPVILPDVPEVPQTDEIIPTTISGVSGQMGNGMGNGQGNGSGNGSTLEIPPPSDTDFGAPNGRGLEGNLYDLKQTSDRKSTDMDQDKYHAKITEFVHADWDPGVLKDYYKSPKLLKTPTIFIPTIHADDGPKAFGVENEVQPNMYVVLYKGTVIPPEDGTYHFVGVADDILVVRANRHTVLDWCLYPVSYLQAEQKKYDITSPHYTPTHSNDAFLWVGLPLHLQAGNPVELEVLIGEQPGGYSNYYLLMQRDETTYPIQDNKTPLLPIFQLDSQPIQAHGNYPPFLTTPAPWKSAPADGSLAPQLP
jgi:hypothetical protein